MTEHSTPADEPTEAPANRHDLLLAMLDGTSTIERAQLTRVEIAPGQAAGVHHHPCDVVGFVVSGTIRFKVDDRDEKLLEAGDGFFEPRNVTVTSFDNASDHEPAVFVACYLLNSGAQEVIVMEPAER